MHTKNPPPPVIKDRVEEYKVESILDSSVFRNKLEYLVHWKGYGVEENEWRLAEYVKGTGQLYQNSIIEPEAPQYISSLDFPSLPFRPISNFTDTLDTVPSGWAQVIACWNDMPIKGG